LSFVNPETDSQRKGPFAGRSAVQIVIVCPVTVGKMQKLCLVVVAAVVVEC